MTVSSPACAHTQDEQADERVDESDAPAVIRFADKRAAPSPIAAGTEVEERGFGMSLLGSAAIGRGVLGASSPKVETRTDARNGDATDGRGRSPAATTSSPTSARHG